MRLYAFLLVAGAVLHAHAASLPVSETEKKLIDIVPDNLDKISENTSSEQELIDQANTIKDVDNKLRVKPEDIPVEVIVENAHPALKTDDEKDEVDRPGPDLRNPGPPQRQEHETQNPEYYASEQQTILLFKQSINDAQNVLRQGFQGIADGIQNMLASNEPIQTIQQNIQSLRDGFTAQINKLNGTIQSYLNTENANVNQLAVEQTKAGFHQFEKGLFKLRNDFNSGVNTLADGVEVVAYLKADGETPNVSSGSAPAPANPAPSPAPVFPVFQYLQGMQTAFSNTLQNLTDSFNQITQNGWNPFSQTPSTTAVAAEGQSATSAAPPITNIFQNWQQQLTQNPPPLLSGISSYFQQPGSFGSGTGPIASAWNNVVNIFNPKPAGQTPQGTQPATSVEPVPTVSKPDETANKPENKPEAQAEPVKPAAGTDAPAQAAAAPPAAPIRQILQNNPISQGIASAVQRLQNINNPEKPRDAEQVKKPDEDKAESESKKGGGPNTGDNNDSSNSNDRIELPEAVKEEIEKIPEVQVPEVQKPTEADIKEHKTEEVVDKTE